QADEGGGMSLPETSAVKLLASDGRIQGVRTGDRGRGREGQELGNFEPGADVVARVTVLAEGTQGHLTGVALNRFGLAGENPQVWRSASRKSGGSRARSTASSTRLAGRCVAPRGTASSAGRSSTRWARTW